MITNPDPISSLNLDIMHATHTFVAAFALAALVVPVMSADPECNKGGSLFYCRDAQTACDSVTKSSVSVSFGQNGVQIASFGSVSIWLIRAVSSSTTDDMNALCNQIISSCCPGGTNDMDQRTVSASKVALAPGEEGFVQIKGVCRCNDFW